MGEVGGHGGFVQELGGDADSLEGRIGVEPGGLDVLHELVAALTDLFGGYVDLQFGFGGLCSEAEAVKDGDGDVDAGWAVPAGLEVLGCARD